MFKRFKFLLTVLFSALLTISVMTACNANQNASSGSGSRTVTMATSADYPPYEYVDSSSGSQEIIGFDVDIAKEITSRLGYDLQIQNIDFNGLIPALQAKRADFVMAGMTPTTERKQNVDFTRIYYEAKNTIVARQGSNFRTADALKGKTIGVQLGTIQEGVANDFNKEKNLGINIKPLNRINEIVQELKAGRIEAAIVEDTVAKGYIQSNPDLEFNTIPNEGEAGSAIAFPKGSELTAEFDRVLGEMIEGGQVEELVSKWFSTSVPATK